MKDILVIDSKERQKFWINLKSGLKIFYATAAYDGLNMLSENIGLVFLNLKLLDSNSMEALRLIKKAYPSIEIILITSNEAEEPCSPALRKGTSDYVGKPLNAEEILQKIKTLINTNDVSQKQQPKPLSTETVKAEPYPDMPHHLANGILRVRDFIAQNYAESLTLSDACKMASVCKTYFCSFFKRITGHSLRRYHHIVKIRKAEELLRDKRISVTDVALKLGYDDSNYFSTIHKKITGFSPREWQMSYPNLYREKGKLKTATVVQGMKPFQCKSDSEFRGILREWQAYCQDLYKEKEPPAALAVVQRMKPSHDKSDSEFRGILREWQAYCQDLYKEKEPPVAAETVHKMKSSFINKKITIISPRCQKAAARSLDKIKEINQKLENTLEYFEP